MPVDVSSFNQNHPAPQNPLDMLINVGRAADALGGLSVGRAMQGAIDPATGNIDQDKLIGQLVKSPMGAARAVPTLDAIQKLKQAGYATNQAGLETFQKRMATTYHLFGGLASKSAPTGEDVLNVATKALDPALGADKVGITMPVIMNAVKQFKDKNGNWLPAAQIRQKALEIQTQAGTTAEILAAHAPRYQVIDRGGQLVVVPMGTQVNPALGTVVKKNLPPTTPIATPSGARYLGEQPASPGEGIVAPGDASMGRGSDAPPAGTGSALPAVPTGPAASLAPGQPEAMATAAGEGARLANELTRANDTSPGRKAILGNLEHLLGQFTSGKGADWTLMAKNFANRNLPVPDKWQKEGGVLDLKSVKSQEEFNKLAVQLAQQQFAAIGGTGTDAKFSSAFETSPNELLSNLGNKSIIRLLRGNEDAIQAKNKAWRGWLKNHSDNPGTYADFSQDFNTHFDPRVFQFKYLDPKERQGYVDKMDADELSKFLHDLTYARKQGWVAFEQPKK